MKALLDHARYCVASTALALGLAGMWLGGHWVWLGVAAFVAIAVADFLSGTDTACRDPRGRFFYELVLYLPLPMMIALWLLLAQHVRAADLGAVDLVGAVISTAFLSALAGLPAAHELMHRPSGVERLTASAYLTLFLLPFNDLGHVWGHHNHVGTPADSDTPRRGEPVYTFVARALWGQFMDSVRLERERLRRLGRSPLWWGSRFVQGAVLVAAWLAVWFATAGVAGGLPVYAATLLLAYIILGGFNYTQHYGLVRVPGSPIEAHHSWNHLKTFSRAVTFEISNHSEHHLDPPKHYESLRPYPEAPQMPSIVACFLASFVPPLWERLIARPRLAHWDAHYASPEERRLAEEANRRAGWA